MRDFARLYAELDETTRTGEKVEALTAVGNGPGKQTVIVPASALEAFGDAFKMLKGRG